MKTFLLVEDEEYAMEDLKDLLLGIDPTLEIQTARNASEAMQAIEARTFDAIFLDIEMPGMTGIEMLQAIHHPLPPVVLVTAHALHALDAFGLGVVQCLLKPVDINRLRATYERLVSTTPVPQASHDLHVPDHPNHFDAQSYILFREGSRVCFVKVYEISRLQGDGETTHVYYKHGSGSVRKSLADFEARLDPRIFFRVNASDVVNLDSVDRITSTAGGQLIAHFADGLEIPFSPERSRIFEQEHGV